MAAVLGSRGWWISENYQRVIITYCSPGFLLVLLRFRIYIEAIGQIMELRTRITSEMKQAMKDKATARLSTLRLINAAIKDRDIAARGEGNEEGVDDTELLAILGKMVRQRQESAKAYEEAGRLDLSEREIAEISIIEEFLPRQLSDKETEDALNAAIAEVGASSIRDMGRVMSLLKANYTGQMNFGAVGPMVKERLSN